MLLNASYSQIGIREKSLSADCGQSEKEIEALVTEINKKHRETGPDPVLYFHIQDSVSLNERIPLWMAADVLMTTGIRDGLNLLPMEFCVARRSPPGVLIISEFTGCGRVLVGAIPVNPWQQEQMVNAIHHALTMPDKERQARHDVNLEAVMGNTTSQWAMRMLQDLNKVSSEAMDRHYLTYGLALSCKVVAVYAQFQPAQVCLCVRALRLCSLPWLPCPRFVTLHRFLAGARDQRCLQACVSPHVLLGLRRHVEHQTGLLARSDHVLDGHAGQGSPCPLDR